MFIFSGEKDEHVVQGVSKHAESLYKNFGADIKTKYNVPAAHAMITNKHGGPCGQFESPYINNCKYDGAFEALDHILGNLKPSLSNFD